MSKEKQIEEMAFNLIMATSPLGVKDLTKKFDYKTVATDLYELYGWRKQIEAEWLSTYDFAVKLGVTDEDRLASAKGDKWWKFCSRCDQQVKWHYNYCPNCGAKMKGAV